MWACSARAYRQGVSGDGESEEPEATFSPELSNQWWGVQLATSLLYGKLDAPVREINGVPQGSCMPD